MAIRRRRIQDLVDRLLRDNEVTNPPVPVERIAKKLGIAVSRQRYDGDEISGFLYRDAKKTVIGVNGDHHANRQRFTIAHECGHFLLHDQGLGEVHVDKAYQVKLRSDASSKGTNIEEIEANTFAAELLMPESFLRSDLEEMETLDIENEDLVKKLARQYQVSTQALMFRLAGLGYASL